VRLIIIDTVARAVAGGDENSSTDMGRLIAACDQIRTETGAHVALIHHAGKDAAKGARGHSSLRAAVDTEIEITAEAPIHTLQITKQRDLASKGLRLSARFVSVELGLNQWGKPRTACVVEPIDAPSSHMAALMRQTDERQADQVVLRAFKRLQAMGINATDGKTSPNSLPKQVLEKHLGEGLDRTQINDAMNRLMVRGVFRRDVVGQYGANRAKQFGLVLSEEATA